ncbi:hypothetical protein Trydic_g17451 [Trypoxylus dichotomus]
MADEMNKKTNSDSAHDTSSKSKITNGNSKEDFDSVIQEKFSSKGDPLLHHDEKSNANNKQEQSEDKVKNKPLGDASNKNINRSGKEYPAKCASKSPIRFESREDASSRKVRWSPPRRSRSPEIYRRSPRRSSRSPIRYSRSPRRRSRSPRRYSRSPRSFRDLPRRSPIEDGRRLYNAYRSRSPSVELLDDSREKIMTMKAKVVETGLVPPGMEMDFDLVTMCQDKGTSKGSRVRNRGSTSTERNPNDIKRNNRGTSPSRTTCRYSPPVRRISPEPRRYRTFLEEIEDTFAYKQTTPSTSKEAKDKSRKFTNPFATAAQFSTNPRNNQTGSHRSSGSNSSFMFQYASQLVSELGPTPSTSSGISANQKGNRKEEGFKLQLHADKKSVSPNLNLNSTDKPKTIHNKINVISQCQNAIKLLSGEVKGGHFKVQDAARRSERAMDLKGICPFRKVRSTRFQYTSKQGAVENPDDVSATLNRLLSKIGKELVFEVTAGGAEVIDLCASPGTAPQERRQISIDLVGEDEKVHSGQTKEPRQIEKLPPSLLKNPIAVAYKQPTNGVASVATQTDTMGCAECQRRESISRDNIYTQTDDNHLYFDVSCQVNLDDTCPKSPKSILKKSLAQLTPAQLLHQRSGREFLSDKFESISDFSNSKRPRLSNMLISDLDRREMEEKLYNDLLSSGKRSGASAFFDLPSSSSSYKSNRYEDIVADNTKLYSRDRPQMIRATLGKSSLPFSNFDPKLNFDATKWIKKY